MNDLIRRQDAIEAVSKACFELRGIFGQCEDAIKELPSAERKGEWIPVTERLPEMRGYYLVTKYKESENIPVMVDCNFYFDDSWCCNGDVIAWMPLPSPYTEGEVES